MLLIAVENYFCYDTLDLCDKTIYAIKKHNSAQSRVEGVFKANIVIICMTYHQVHYLQQESIIRLHTVEFIGIYITMRA